MSTETPEICLLKVGEPSLTLSARHGLYEDWFTRALEPLGVRPSTFDLRALARTELPPADGYLIMGAPEAVFDPLPWLKAAKVRLQRLFDREQPLLGVCFGHQLLAGMRGGEVVENPNGWEIGTVTLELTDAGRQDPLFEGLPERFPVQATHRDAVVAPPSEATLLARSALDEFSAFRLAERVWTVQFHPEIDPELMAEVIDSRREILEEGGLRPDALIEEIAPTPASRTLLENFLRLTAA